MTDEPTPSDPRQVERLRQLAVPQYAILDALPAHVAVIDATGSILAVNESWRRFAAANGLEMSDFAIGQNYLAVCEQATGDCADESGESAAGIRRVLNREVPQFHLEYPCHSPSEQRWFRLMVSSLVVDGHAGAVIMHVDVTARKLAELALRASERQFASAFIHAAIGVALVSPEGRLLAANRALCVLLGYAEAELIGRTSDSLTHPDDLEAGRASIQRMLSGDVHRSQREKRYLRKDGTTIQVQLTSSLVRDEHGTPVHFIAQMQDLTEHRRATAEVRTQAHMLDQIGQAVITTDLAGTIIFANRYAGELYGWSPSELVGKSIMEVTVTKATQSQAAAIMSQLRRGEPWHGEFIVRNRAGREFPVEITSSHILDERGQLVGIVGVSNDISERKQAEAAMARLAAIVESSDDAILGRDLQGIITSWNRGAEKIYGYTAAEMVGRSILPLIPAGTVDEEKLLFDKIRQGQSVDRLETKRVTRDGRLIDVSVRLSPIRDAAGSVNGVAEIARDITQTIQARAGLVASESRFRRLVESNAQGVLFWTADGRITDANDALLTMLGFTRSDLEAGGLSWIALTPPEFASLDTRAVAEVASKGVCAPYEKEFLSKDGRRVPILIAGARVDDSPEQGVAFVTDLTERKKLEKQFLRGQRLESIGTLAGGMAHDLNNVLAPILMAIELLKEDNPGPESKEILATIETSARRGADLVRQVLAFARGVEGERVQVTMAPLMNDLLKVLRDTFPKSIDLQLESAPNLWVVSGDPTQLHQVFMNLCVNARDAMPNGGRLQLAMENVVLDETYTALNPDGRPGAYVMVWVADTGTGIPREIREQVFEPFYTTKEIGQGTGLGLSTTMAIVKSHGGFINLYSEVGVGTKFKVYLPAHAEAAVPEAVTTGRDDLPRGDGELVLVVDDEDSVRDIARRTLERYGYEVALAANGAEAVAVYARRRADVAVVLTDMSMPIMDGPALIVSLRAINADVKIIGSSGLSSNRGIARALGAGVAHFVPKPYTARVLLTTLRKALAGEPPA